MNADQLPIEINEISMFDHCKINDIDSIRGYCCDVHALTHLSHINLSQNHLNRNFNSNQMHKTRKQ